MPPAERDRPDRDLRDPETAGRTLKEDADSIVESLEELRAIEERKRHETPTTTEYHELSERATSVARDVFRGATQEDRDRERIAAAENGGDKEKPPSAAELERRARDSGGAR